MSDSTPKPAKVAKEDWDILQNLKANAAFCKTLTQKAVAEQKASELEVQNAILRLYMKYGLGPHDQIDQDGSITRVEITPVMKEAE